MTTVSKKPVVVTTEHRGVFFGFIPDAEVYLHPADGNAITVTEAQMCVYWSADVRGVLGLAATGPTRSCKITPAVGKMTLQGVTSVMDATAEAVKAWQGKPWS